MASSSHPLSRRAFIGGMAATLLASPAGASGMEPRTIALDWASAQNLLALGIIPLAMPEIERYDQLVVEPAAPRAMMELGLRSEPNLELLASLKPDLLIGGDDLAPMRERLETIAPVVHFDPDRFGEPDLLAGARQALADLATRLNALSPFETFVASLDNEIEGGRRKLHAYDGRPLFVAAVLDGRRMLVFGRNSLFQSVLDRFGIENAWTGFTSRYGHATVNIDRLAERPEARLLCVGNETLASIDRLRAAPVISSLPFVRARRIALIPDVLFYGGLPPARRFARLVSTALSAGGNG